MGNDLTIIVRGPGGAERTFLPRGRSIRVGRDGDNDLVLPDPRVAGRHAILEVRGRHLEFRNLSRGAPLRLNGEPLDAGSLAVGDELEIGDCSLTLLPAAAAAEDARLALLAEIVNFLPREANVDRLFARTLAAIARILDIRRAFVALRPDGDSELEVVATLNLETEGAPVEVSRTILQHVLESREGLLASNAMVDPELRLVDSVIDLRIKSVLCVPILTGGEAAGVLYGDNRDRARSFGPEDLRFLTLLARILGILLENLRASLELHEENLRLKRILTEERRLVGASPALEKLRSDLRRAAASDATILITGETGTGKNLVAEVVHEMSRRAGAPFVEVSCAAIPETLLEAELFGYGPRSGISGADPEGRPGRFETAGEGTLLLDEIADMSHALQAKILNVLEGRRFTRLGSNGVREVRCRILAATNRDLAVAVEAGSFRKDLYYRLRVIPLHIPPLRERPEDVIPLAEHLLRRMAPDREVRLDPAALPLLLGHTWPGNAREVRNALEHALAFGDGRTVGPEELRAFLAGTGAAPEAGPSPASLDAVVRSHVLCTLRHHGFNKTRAAESLGISRSTLYEWIRRLDLRANPLEEG